jgi:hypothetical protein
MIEIWKDIKGYEGLYQVSNLGRVINVKRNNILNPIPRNHKIKEKFESYRVKIKDKLYTISKLVAQAFVINNNPVRNTKVLHKNEELPLDKINHSVNLYWGTQKDNMEDMVNKNRQAKGEKIATCVLTEEKVLQICDYIDLGFTDIEIGKMIGINRCIVYGIKTGRTWGWLTGRGG